MKQKFKLMKLQNYAIDEEKSKKSEEAKVILSSNTFDIKTLKDSDNKIL